jgi:hypothetical protein
MGNGLESLLDELYKTFSNYRIGDLARVSCFDLGPTAAELAGIQVELRHIPEETLAGMEFFAYGWRTWGTKQEVGYFLPRLMEYLAQDMQRLGQPGLFGLFKYKLTHLFAITNQDWTGAEKESIRKVVYALLQNHFAKSTNLGLVVEWALILAISPQAILDLWQYDQELYPYQMVALFKHFKFSPSSQSHPQGLHFKDSVKIKEFLDLVTQRLEDKYQNNTG